LFQFMPVTAKRFSLSLAPVDERKNPDRSAHAAARYLKFLYGSFKSWPLAIAAFNAGEGRVQKALDAHSRRTFEAIAPDLPIETRMYVPKVAAIIALREGVDNLDLPAPTAVACENTCPNVTFLLHLGSTSGDYLYETVGWLSCIYP
jgi:membrane-bound lytic murein transglycosylase D